jgi:hypothetical protein
MKTEMIHLGEFTYVLLGPNGGHRAEGVDMPITDDLFIGDQPTPYFDVASSQAARTVNDVFECIIKSGATDIRFVENDNQPFSI